MISQFLINGLVAGCFYVLLVVSFGLIYGTVRFFHFAHGGVYTIGAYVLYSAYVLLEMPIYFAIPAVVLVTGGFGVLIDRVVYRPLRARGGSPLILLLASLGIYVLLQNGISMIFDDSVKSVRMGEVGVGIDILGAKITIIQIYIIAVSIISVGLGYWLMRSTRVGKQMRAVASDPELSRVIGIDVDWMHTVAFFVGSVLVGIAAILGAFHTDITPVMGFSALLMGVVAVVIGGVGSLPGGALGALLLGFAQHLGVWKLGTQWQDAITFGLLFLFLVFRPYGIMGIKLRKSRV